MRHFLLALLLLIAGGAEAAQAKYVGLVPVKPPNSGAGSTISVTVNGTGAPASLYADNGSTVVANPMRADSYGVFQFTTAVGTYDILITRPDGTTTLITKQTIGVDTTIIPWATPGTIGSTTPNTGAFTTLSATGAITSTLATGTAPFTVASTTLVPNLYVARSALADTVTTNHNMTGPITGTGNVTSITAQTGTGTTFVMDTSPTLVTPNLGTPSAVVLTNATGTAASLTAGLATNTVSKTGTGSVYATSTSPTFVTPTLGAATATSLTSGSVTNSSLTSGRVPYATTAGLMADSASLLYNGSNTLTVGDGTTAQSVNVTINGAAAQQRILSWQTATANRLQIRVNNAAETGSDAGSIAQFLTINDAGTADIFMAVPRTSGGAITYSRPLQPGSGSTAAPSFAFSTDTTTGFYRNASGVIGVVSAGVLKQTMGSQNVFSANPVSIGTTPITSLSLITLHSNDGVGATLTIASYGSPSAIGFRRADGTSTSMTGLVSGDDIGLITVQGYEPTTPGFATARNAYKIEATETWSSTAQGYRHIWNTTAGATVTNNEKMRLEASGSLLIGTTTDGMTAGGSLAVVQDFRARQTTDSTSVSTGSAVISGGEAVTKNLIVGQGVHSGVASTVTAAGTTTLTSSSARIQKFTGTTTQTVQLPAANLFGAGISIHYTIINRSTGTVTWTPAGSDTVNGTAGVVTNTVSDIYSDGVSAWYTK